MLFVSEQFACKITVKGHTSYGYGIGEELACDKIQIEARVTTTSHDPADVHHVAHRIGLYQAIGRGKVSIARHCSIRQTRVVGLV